MQVQTVHFHQKSIEKLKDARLQESLKRLSTKFVTARAQVITELPDLEANREAAKQSRDTSIANLDVWLDVFERNATAAGVKVLWARTHEEACDWVAKIAQHHGVKTITKTKSMVTEEMGLNKSLEAKGYQVRETDLGEYILQINDAEPPSHIIAPVIHKDKEEIADLFEKTHGKPRKTDIPELTREAREVLRPEYFASDMGITGGNFLVAETGSVAVVTNEGNEGMCTLLPKVHVAITGIEKVVPTLEDFSNLIRLLTRSATGQSISNYVSLFTGPKRQGDLDGPEHMYIVLVDAGRSGLLGGDFQDMLRCIRCGACMNHCPVYQKIGGHAYGWVYPGPMGSVLTPAYVGVEQAMDLPQAATLCGQCHVVCPVQIPLPDLLRKLRQQQTERGIRPWQERVGLKVWAWVARKPLLYRFGSRLASKVLGWIAAKQGGSIQRLVGMGGWTKSRHFPAPQANTFMAEYRRRKGQ